MSQRSPKVVAILLAGGSGSRMNGAVSDKVLLQLAGKPVFQHSLEAFQASQAISHFVIVYRDSAQKAELEKLTNANSIEASWALGGAERHNSVFNGLQKCPLDTETVLIHDCARPLITPQTIQVTAENAQKHGSACVAKRVADTIKQASPSDATPNAFDLQSLDRSKLWAMETPQAFRYSIIKDAYAQTIASGSHITDDLSAIENMGVPTVFTENERPNQKLTTPADIHFLEFILQHDQR